MSHMLIFGLGYTASRLAAALREAEWTVDATGSAGNVDFADEAAVCRLLAETTHVVSSVPPAEGTDPVLDRYGEYFGSAWLGYLSSTGVYGDAAGAWVDESASTGGGRRKDRAECDARWLAKGARAFRLPGIYGPRRSAFERVQSGKANRIDLPGQVFSRVHVDDIVAGVIAGLDGPPGAYNLSDDLPCPQNTIIEEASRLLGIAPPPLQTLEEANLSEMALGFYSENRRVANSKAKRVLGWQPQYPDYRAGLRSLL
ncbi:SDR family NAD(P)-dependent oxidoreductase [Altererythrobacter sp. RZ02]|uniref:SDR family NAD(P)-dependent oxidoreductase n=1 Tax=Pontixanthobacter rizhaonensis TaxID=2730337 RepID=A0A848QQB2_9SPHN|nr:SDR family NAD(P)-dependent oxidoreductase [Pontixanthobacter rizhaonensis]NMW32767.1 SDR family NAD(P)-dependent oxidoreductase [Pontixanthobacter rizhaonensis]